MSVLETIIAGVRADLAQRIAQKPLVELLSRIDSVAEPIDPIPTFSAPGISVIAEVKRCSPSKGMLNTITNPAELAAQYETGGAAAISVLTEQRRFGGSLADLDAVRARVQLPVLRKDFMIDRYQFFEARAHGADLILLIVAALDERQLKDFLDLTRALGMTALVETHNAEEIMRAVDAGAQLIGINNRNLKTLAVDPTTFTKLAPSIPKGIVRVAESGIFSAEDIPALSACGADAILVGEALVKSGRPAATITSLIAAGRKQGA